MSKRCSHNYGWYIREASLFASSDGSELELCANGSRGSRRDKALAVCNGGCGATRNVYLTAVDFTFGKIRRAPVEAER